MPRLLPAVLAVCAAGLLVAGALLPEYKADGFRVTPLDPEVPGWAPALVGTLVHVGLLLVPALMLLLGANGGIAGGILTGAGVLGLSLRAVRLFQLREIPQLDPALGSWVDLLGEGVALSAGILALAALGARGEPEPEALEPDLAPPPGEPV